MVTPEYVLIIAYWLHMVATVIWIGSLVAISLIVIPVASKNLPPDNYLIFIQKLQKKLEPVAWFSLILLLATGMIQMSANPNYGGFLAVDNRWSTALFIKHIFFILMTAISAYMTWFLFPGLQRAATIRSQSINNPALEKNVDHLAKQEALMLRLNLILGMIVLALTAVARVS